MDSKMKKMLQEAEANKNEYYRSIWNNYSIKYNIPIA